MHKNESIFEDGGGEKFDLIQRHHQSEKRPVNAFLLCL
jgi:hypothetical protein